MFSLEGKTALITGASGGIGGAIAELFHKQGATILISGTRENALVELANKLGNQRVFIKICNLSNLDNVKELAEYAEEKLGSIDILVCNAGITKDNLSMRMKDEEWQDVINVNLTSSFVLIRSCLKAMMKKRYGRIINISSIVGETGNPGQANYAASKGGLVAMSKSIAYEVATRNITVNCIAPGFIQTNMTDVLNDAQKEMISKKIPMNRLGNPEDIASAALFLASDTASYITGETIHVNGGMLMA